MGHNASTNKGPASSGSNMPFRRAMDEIPGCTAQLLEVGIPWSQDFLASFFRLHLILIPSPLKRQLRTQQLPVCFQTPSRSVSKRSGLRYKPHLWPSGGSAPNSSAGRWPCHPCTEGCRGLRGTAGGDRCFIPEMRWLKFELTHDMADCSLSGSQCLGKKGTA